MSSAKIEALKAVVLVLLTALASLGVIATDIPNAVAPVVAAVAAAVGVFTIHRPQDVEQNIQNAAIAGTVQDVAFHNLATQIDVPIGPAGAPPEAQVVVPVTLTPPMPAPTVVIPDGVPEVK